MNLCKRFATAATISLMCALSVAALAVPTAGAATRARTTRVTGVVRSINAARHSVTIATTTSSGRVHHTKLLTFNVTAANVLGHHGTVAVGDRISVTLSGSGAGGSGGATTIRVLGVVNGGTGGNGAVVAGEVSAVDASNGTVTLLTPSAGSEQSPAQTVLVEVTSSTVLAVRPAADGSVSLSDINTGDHVIVITADVTADPIVALGVIDSSNLGSNHSDPTLPPAPPVAPQQSVTGVVTSIDAAGGSLLLTDQAGAGVTVLVGDQTPVYQVSGSSGKASALDQINPGDTVRVRFTGDLSSQITASVVYDMGPAPTPPPPTPPTPTPPGPTPPSTQTKSITGVVTSVDLTGSSVEIDSGGTSVDVLINDQTAIYQLIGNSGRLWTLGQVNSGDGARVKFTGDLSSQITATVFYDLGPSNAPAPPVNPTPPTPPAPSQTGHINGTVTHVYANDDALEIALADGGSLLVAVNGRTVIDNIAGGGNQPETLAEIQIGDSVEVTWTSAGLSYVTASEINDGGH